MAYGIAAIGDIKFLGFLGGGGGLMLRVGIAFLDSHSQPQLAFGHACLNDHSMTNVCVRTVILTHIELVGLGYCS